MAVTKFTVKGEVEIYYDGKVLKHHNNLDNTARKIICHCLAGDNSYSINAMRLLYRCNDDPVGYTRFVLSKISDSSFQNNDTELKLNSLFKLEFGENSTSATILMAVLEVWFSEPGTLPAGTPPPLQFSICDLSDVTPSIETSSKQLSINWTIKPQ